MAASCPRCVWMRSTATSPKVVKSSAQRGMRESLKVRRGKISRESGLLRRGRGGGGKKRCDEEGEGGKCQCRQDTGRVQATDRGLDTRIRRLAALNRLDRDTSRTGVLCLSRRPRLVRVKRSLCCSCGVSRQGTKSVFANKYQHFQQNRIPAPSQNQNLTLPLLQSYPFFLFNNQRQGGTIPRSGA